MPQTIPCPHCRRQLNVQEAQLGEQVRCPACQQIFTAAVPPPLSGEEAKRVVSAGETRPAHPADPLDFGEEEDDPTREEDEDHPRGRPHHGSLILTLGILGLVLSCCPLAGWILGGCAMSLAGTDLYEMAARRMDRSGRGLTRAGKILGTIAVLLSTLFFVLSLLRFLGRGFRF
jgi:predicted Zn finger-like uncharacterized protein